MNIPNRPFEATLRNLDAAASLTRAGEVRRAANTLAVAVEKIAAMPASNVKTYLDARATLERARLKWLGGGLDRSFSLQEALTEAMRSSDMLGDEADVELRADIAAVIAGIAYDLGDLASLAIAEAELDTTIAALTEAGADVEAGRLLNGQAAVQLRLGHDLHAAELLLFARRLLEEHLSDSLLDQRARHNLANTRHLLARLALHARSELTDDAIVAAIAHAHVAEETYRRLGLRRELARVWETIARLEEKRGHVDDARVGFVAAIAVEDDLYDLTGLASMEGLAELLAKSGDAARALDMIASSIELNRVKDSSIGLDFDEQALAAIERLVAEMPDASDAVRSELARTKKRLLDAKRSEDT